MALNYPRLGSASGVWNMKEVTDAVKGGYWPNAGARGVVGGNNPFATDIEYVTIMSTGNGTDFGDLTTSKGQLGSTGSFTRGFFVAGDTPSNLDDIDYITIMTTGNAADFGNLTTTAETYHSGCGDSVRGVFAGGYEGGYLNIIDYIQMASLGDATDFGDLTVARQSAASTSSPTRGLWMGGSPKVIDYVTIATLGDAVDFGDLTASRDKSFSASSGTRGICAAGIISGTPACVTSIDFVEIASTGNAIDYGDLTQARQHGGAADNSTRAVCMGGQTTPAAGTVVNTIDYINSMAVGGIAVDFGDCTATKSYLGGCSNAHGGLNDGNQGVVDTT